MMAASRRRAAGRNQLRVGDDGMRQRLAAPAFAFGGHCAHGVANHAARVFGIAVEIGDDLGQRHGAVLRMPAIVIGDHGHGGVAKLRFARQLRFGDVGHADDFEAQLAVHVRFGQRRKLRPFDADVSPAAMRLHAGRVAGRAQHARELRAGGLVEAHVGHDAAAEKRGHAPVGAVEKLVWDHEVQRGQIFAQRADRAYGDHALDSEQLHGVEIGAIVDLRRHQAMAARVPREESDALAFERADHERVGGIAEGRLHAHIRARAPGPAWSKVRCRQ